MLKIRVAIIGAGRMGQRHAQAYKMIKDIELVGFSDSIVKNAKKLSRKFHCKTLSIKQILEDKNINVVNICTPNSEHAKLAIMMLNSGKHVLVEKPMAMKIKDCDKMINAAKKNKRNLMVGQTYRFYPSSITAKKIIDSGQIGKIRSVQIHGIDPGFIKGQKKMPQWFKQKKFGGGLLFDMVHIIDLLRYWLKSEISYVYVPLLDKIHDDATTEQICSAILKFQNGTSVSIMSIAPSWGIRDQGIKMVGKKGLLNIVYGEKVELGQKSWKQFDFPYKAKNSSFKHNLMGFRNELLEFINSIKEKREPLVSGTDGKKNVEVILAMYKSHKLNKLIRLKK